MKPWLLQWLICSSLMAVFPGPLLASSVLREAMHSLAVDLKSFLDGRNLHQVSIGQFAGPANYPTSAGPGLALLLTEELTKVGVAVQAGAMLGVKGEYKVGEVPDDKDPKTKLLAVEISGIVQDSFGKVLTDFTFSRKLVQEQALLHLLGGSVELPSTPSMPAPNKTRDHQLREMFVDPRSYLQGSRICPSARSPFAMEILVHGSPRPAQDQDGLAFVPIARGETYAVRLYNDTNLEMAVQLTIDGLNLFTFSEMRSPHGGPLYSVVILAPRSHAVVPGWHRTNKLSDSFQVTSYAKSAAASLNHTEGVGTITATFCACWEHTPPTDEPPQTKSLGGDATGFGPRIETNYTELKRQIGSVRASISSRYKKNQ